MGYNNSPARVVWRLIRYLLLFMTTYSKIGERFLAETGTRRLMDDLGEVLTSGRPILNLGGGNPGSIEAVRVELRHRMQNLLDDGRFDDIVSRYDGPQGHEPFRQAVARLLKRQFGWELSAANIALTTGSQASFFVLFNLLAGACANGEDRHILLPLTPEYIGYADVGLQDNCVKSIKPTIEIIDEHSFKYHVDFERLKVNDNVAALCVSRPTNPTGNVITDAELNGLLELSRRHDTPLIVDNAYGLPFPHIVFTDVRPVFDEHVILCMSLSKLGLPGLRTGIIVAAPEIVDAVTSANAISMLANSSIGASLVCDLIESEQILQMSREIIAPFYREKCRQARAWCREYFTGINYYLHETEGAIFLWVWFPDLPITDEELYKRLKERDVLVLAGHHFFPGLDEAWDHTEQCLRVSYAQDPEAVRSGIKIIGEEVRRALAA